MSVSRATAGRRKPVSNTSTAAKEPLLIVSFELNKPTRPKMTIYEDSDIPKLIEEFVKLHRLKGTASAIISNVINKNMAEMRQEEQRSKANSRQGKSMHSKQTNRKVERPIREPNKENFHSNTREATALDVITPKQIGAPVLTKLLQSVKDSEQCEQVGMLELQQEFERQFKTIRANRMLRGCEEQLSSLYQRLTRLNPPQCGTIDPDFIDFSSFDGQLLEYLEEFFSRLEEDDFVQLDYQKFRELIERHECHGLVQLLTDGGE